MRNSVRIHEVHFVNNRHSLQIFVKKPHSENMLPIYKTCYQSTKQADFIVNSTFWTIKKCSNEQQVGATTRGLLLSVH